MNIFSYINKYGLKVFFSRVLLIIVNPIMSVRNIFKLDLDDIDHKLIDRKTSKADYTLIQMKLSDLDRMQKEHSDEISPGRLISLKEIIEDKYSYCFSLLNKSGNFMGYYCLSYKKKVYEKIFSRIKGLELEKNAYIFREYTFKKYRGMGLQTYAFFERFKLLKNKGFKTVVMRIAKNNHASEHTSHKMGFKKELLEIHFHFFNRFPKSNFIIFNIK